MQTVHVNMYVNASPEQVFAAISDHENFISGEGIKSCRIIVDGGGEREGVGCKREVRATGMRLVEEITKFDRPNRYDYIIRESTVPVDHQGGTLRCFARGEGTEIDWQSTFAIKLPIVGSAITKSARTNLTEQFTLMLLAIKQRLEV